MNGKTEGEIKSLKSELQSFAEQTIYSSSDMASTFAQLDAVGTKNTLNLVKGFGGLAAAAESPTQAMKTLSQQATQMAAKPMVQWQDFKLMVDTRSRVIAAVAKQMGRSTQQLIKDVQDGKVATEDFFDAIATVGTNDALQNWRLNIRPSIRPWTDSPKRRQISYSQPLKQYPKLESVQSVN